jgi:hypothetical protein
MAALEATPQSSPTTLSFGIGFQCFQQFRGICFSLEVSLEAPIAWSFGTVLVQQIFFNRRCLIAQAGFKPTTSGVMRTNNELVAHWITARSTKFSNSRVFPGYFSPVSPSFTVVGTDSICFCICFANFGTKKLISRELSSFRPRSGGIWIAKTFSR